ncbi:GATOR complex protein DEPDC5-like isoform X2 [Asterias rubens]|uniref:GATOR complex protein DEPDC5-like isoform X2 n=1 Tax=Asterias rubens TaxID=7604 RepID=UPI001455D6B1|nr:GATOR complex protein DEPDC5-like isoform X2 [Asterias rubens]
MKLFKLWVHQKGFSEDKLVINPKEFPDVKVGDILEIFHPDEESSHLLLQVKSLQTDLQQKGKDIISVDQTIANLFQLRAYKDVEVCRVSSVQDVGLDLLELVFREQYISRSDMWRLKNNLIDSCPYLSKKVEYSGVRAQVNELWAGGEKVMCGVVTEDTRVAFRSATAMVYMFIQMSSEMWDFDANGDLLWEKAIDGFVSDLFNHWKEKNTTNEVTIFLFSRMYYNATSLDEFPEDMTQCLHVDNRGRIYEDFYRVIVQNERRDDWTPLLVTLKSQCIEYGKQLQHQYKQGTLLTGRPIPSGYISNAAEGNFLEALNLTLNVFDKHYINRNFDRTGQVVVIVTPGAGVFEVDRELYKITKQRMIDNGIGSDLVCMAEQPLHAVPLFRFRSPDRNHSVCDYNIPHWLNYSFYTVKSQQEKCCTFVPRVKLAERKESADDGKPSLPSLPQLPEERSKTQFKTSHQDEEYMFEVYDNEIFKAPSFASPKPRTPFSMRPARASHHGSHFSKPKDDPPSNPSKRLKEPISASVIAVNSDPTDIPNSHHVSQSSSSTAIPIPVKSEFVTPSVSVMAATKLMRETSISRSVGTANLTEDQSSGTPIVYPGGVIVGSASAIHDRISTSPNHQFIYRTLINPFAPSTLAVRLTSNRRRWTHTFPPGPSGETMQPHHRRWTTSEGDVDCYLHTSLSESISAPLNPASTPPRPMPSPSRQPVASALRLAPPTVNGLYAFGSGSSLASDGSVSGDQTLNGMSRSSTLTHRFNSNLTDVGGRFDGGLRTSPISESFRALLRSTSGVWGVTGEQEWSPFIQTGMDWKSLTATACFPITTDYYPDSQKIDRQFMENNYELLADDHDDVVGRQRRTGEGVFQEIISQRLMQGFQLVVLPRSVLAVVQGRRSKGILVTDINKHEYVLSIGRIFHKLVLYPQQRAISVTVYKPRHLNTSHPICYTYQLWSAHSAGYQPLSSVFQTYRLENFNWNYLDNYVSSRGIDFGPVESLKLWRSRFLLLPAMSSKMKKILEDPTAHLDVFSETSSREEVQQFTEGFIKFVETLNRLRRHHSGRRRSQGLNFAVANLSSSRQSPSTTPLSSTPSHVSGTDTPPRSLKEVLDGGVSWDEEGLELERSKLTLLTPLWEVARAMRDQKDGLYFLPVDQRNLPACCFSAVEGVHWIRSNFQTDVSESEAVEVLQNMTEEGLICHASGNTSHPFWNGSYFYQLLKEELPLKEKSKKSPTRQSASSFAHHNSALSDKFHNAWFEVAVCDNSAPVNPAQERVPEFLLPCLPRPVSPATRIMSSFAEMSSNASTDSEETEERRSLMHQATKPASLKSLLFDSYINKTDRVEWCHINYNGCFSADSAWGLDVEWLVSTPSLLVEVLQGWARKAVQCGYHLIPAPMDAFNQCPYFNNPLSCPRFIKLDLQCLGSDEGQRLFEDFNPVSRMSRVHLLQEAILKRFGFIKATDTGHLSSVSYQNLKKDHIQYIHMTGMVLVLIYPPTNQHSAFGDTFSSPNQSPANDDITQSNESQEWTSNLVAEAGYNWVPNYLLTKRWRTSSCGDEKFPERLLLDFSRFCANHEDRLKEFWKRSKEACLQKETQ